MPSVSEIIPNLWIGNKNSVKQSEFKKINNIRCVINCSTKIPFYHGNHQNIRIPVDDDLSKEMNDKLLSYLPYIIETIHYYRMKREGVLVHCYAGCQRSAAIVAAYIMRYTHFSMKLVVQLIQTKRAICFTPMINFQRALLCYEKNVQ